MLEKLELLAAGDQEIDQLDMELLDPGVREAFLRELGHTWKLGYAGQIAKTASIRRADDYIFCAGVPGG